jgi:cytochrome b subunit of formate dehydrogenase
MLGLLVAAGLSALPPTAFAQGRECTDCHDDESLQPAAAHAHSELSCKDCHSNITRAPHRLRELTQLQGDAICTQCHEPPALASHAEEGCTGCHGPPHQTTTPDENICTDCHSRAHRTLGRSVHGKDVGCTDCHGDLHSVVSPEDFGSRLSAVNQIRTCGGCHQTMMDGYLISEHSKALLVSGLISAPACTDCHGAHNIRSHDNPAATTSHGHIPETCGSCHALILERWTGQSAHGFAWKEGVAGPVCSTCHKAHAITEPTQAETRLGFPEACGHCHGELYTTFRDSFHGQATQLGYVTTAICSDCHTPHRNLPADDPRSSVHPDHLAETCGQCHGAVNASFLTFDPHSDPSDPDRNPKVYFVYLFMLVLLLGVFAFFGVHDLLWLQRGLVAAARGELKGLRQTGGPYVKRFSDIHVWTHGVVVVSFLLLAATGLPLRFSSAPWAQPMMDLFGGPELAGGLHRVAAVVTFGYFAFHVLQVLYESLVERKKGYFWGPHSMVPQPKDFKDLWANLKYFFYLGPPPPVGRWAYWEKFDYLAVFWGVAVIGLSGLMLWLPDFFTRFLPGWALNAAFVIHSEEALLATGFIFIFHFFHVQLRPEVFPLDPVIFTGRMSLERFKEERPMEYERLVEHGELESRLVDPPSRSTMRKAHIFGFTATGIGIFLAVAIFWALLAQL